MITGLQYKGTSVAGRQFAAKIIIWKKKHPIYDIIFHRERALVFLSVFIYYMRH